jgi:hypothetical protein
MPAKASQEERILLYQLNSKVVDLPYIADTLDESSNLAKRDSSPIIAVPDYCYEGIAV